MKKEILKLFEKYGFNSLKEPFLYEDKNHIGIYYSFKDEDYGLLNRVFIPNDISDLTSFIQNYYSYKNSHCLKIKLSSYNDPFATPIFIDDIELLDEDIYFTNFSLFQSANLIIKIIEEKMKISLLTYENVKKLTDKYTKIQKEICQKKNIPFDEVSDFDPQKIEKIKIEQNNIINNLKQTLNKCLTKKEYKKIIDELVDYLKSLELEDSLLNNKYFMIKLPILIEQLKEELKILDKYNLTKNKRKKKLELEQQLKELATKNAQNKIISLSNFLKIEEQKIKEKYEMISDIDYDSIGNYLVEYDNLSIKPEKNYQEKDGFKILNESFESLSLEEKNILYLSVFFQKIKNDNYLMKEYFKCILNPSNVLAKIKIFKNIELTSFNDFTKSIPKTINKLNEIKKVNNPLDILVYFENSKIINDDFLICSNKKSAMPKKECSNPVKYLVNLKKNSLINYVPSKLIIDYSNEDKIILKENSPIFIVDLKNNKIIDENSDIIKVARVKISEKKTTDIITISKIKIDEVECYKKIIIERNE